MYGKNTVNKLSKKKKNCTLNTPKNSFLKFPSWFRDKNLTDQYP